MIEFPKHLIKSLYNISWYKYYIIWDEKTMKLFLLLVILLSITISSCATKTKSLKEHDKVDRTPKIEHHIPAPNLTPGILKYPGH